ncbi:MAG: Co2+/Mg2+ efflux protein ApaG [Phycisphaerales bacterium]|nr:Co2+/Mg2+ efflux protein ApaG [Phycisphaerales bacterium]
MPTADDSPAGSRGSTAITDGVRVTVVPKYLPSHSDPAHDRFIFNYHVTIANESAAPVRLRSRQWIITDGEGNRHEVNGMGVIGQFPLLAAQEHFEYSSFCPLPTSWGTMEGSYLMEREDGVAFEVPIARFYLVSPHQ